MGKKRQPRDWPDAKKLCRLNDLDIVMAKSLGFKPETLIRSIPSPRQGWKMPVKEWVHELYYERFGEVLGEPPRPIVVAPPPTEEEQEAARRFEEELFWDDYYERNEPSKPSRVSKPQQSPAPVEPCDVPTVDREFTDEDVPF